MRSKTLGLLLSFGLVVSLSRCDCGSQAGDDAGATDATSTQDAFVNDQDAGLDAGVDTDAHVDTDAGPGNDANTDTDAGTGETVETCSGAPTGNAAAGSCEVTTGTSGKTLLVGNVLTPGKVFENGGVLYDDSTGVISCVGCDCAAQATDATTVVCNQAVITPGLINTHDHIGWMKDHPRASEPTADVRYEHRHDWRKGDSSDGEGKITTSGGSSNDEKAWGELRFVLGGGTSVNGSGTAPGLMRNLDKSGGLEGLNSGAVEYSTFPLHDSNGTTLASGCNYPGYDDASVASKVAYTPHVSEGINDFARNEFICLNSDSNGGHDILTQNTALIHGVGLNASDIDAIAAEGMKLIWSPRSNISLYGETAPVTVYKRLGVPIALGTDWIPSGSMNMLRELACADFLNSHYYNNTFSDQDLWSMATYGAAQAVGMQDKIGLLAPGYVADIAVFFDHDADPYGSVVRAEVDDMMLVMRGGEILAGRSEVVSALEDNCDEIDVCGETQRVCLQREIGKSFSALQSSGSGSYALFFCGVPDNEPSCVPFRGNAESQNGSTVYPDGPDADDLDGDGIANDDDDCPNIFNPIRPLDNGQQSDMDNDGVGDVCDVCPLDANTDQCSAYDPNDRDRDGVTDLDDNCVGLANSDQLDADEDGKGDACDACPNDYNPGTQGCPSSITAIQDASSVDHPAEGSSLRISCTVNAIGSKGLWCQERTGGAYSGIYVFFDADPLYADSTAPALGDDISVDGVYTIYYGLNEINNPSISLVQHGAEIEPETVTAADVADNGSLAAKYVGVLVKVENVAVTTQNPDDPNDYDQFVVSDGLYVADSAWDGLDNNYEVGTAFNAIIGVMHFSFDHYKILPRSEADLVFGPPSLSGFNQNLSFQRVSAAATSTLVHSLFVQMNRAVETATDISLSMDDPSLAIVAATVTIPVGAREVEVLVQGLMASTTLAHLTASYDGDNVTTDIRVLADDSPAKVIAIDPDSSAVAVDATQSFAVTLDIPAPLGGSTVNLAVVDAGSMTLGHVPASLAIAENTMSGSFDFTAAAAPASGTVQAFIGTDTPVEASVNVIDPSSMSADLSSWVLTQTDSNISLTIPDGTVLPVGGYLIVARNASKADFEAHWSMTLGENVVFINGMDVVGNNGFPSINGAETYSLSDGSSTVDGATVAMASGNCYQRKVPVTAAGDANSWNTVADSAGTPGSGQDVGNPATGVYISEFCDASGSGNYVFEYVELFFDGNP